MMPISAIVSIILARCFFYPSDIFPVHKLGLTVGQTGTSNRAGPGRRGIVEMKRQRLVMKSQPSAILVTAL